MSDDWLKQRANEMRRAPTLNERRLWKLLRDRRLDGLKFRRQVVIGRYVVDFLCLRHRLIIEADGPHHEVGLDAERDVWLTSENFKILRFPNAAIERNANDVVLQILKSVNERVVSG
ncbi:MAG: DUF559 domain-containing protein [Pseudomonadota bacterium]